MARIFLIKLSSRNISCVPMRHRQINLRHLFISNTVKILINSFTSYTSRLTLSQSEIKEHNCFQLIIQSQERFMKEISCSNFCEDSSGAHWTISQLFPALVVKLLENFIEILFKHTIALSPEIFGYR